MKVRRLSIFVSFCVWASLIFAGYTQQPIEVTFHQIARLPVGAKAGELRLHIAPNRMVVPPRLLPPDKDGFWVIGEAKGGIMRINRLREVVTTLRLEHRIGSRPCVNSLGQIALHFLTKEGEEIAIYSPTGQRLGGFKVNGCLRCKHPFLDTMIGLDEKERVWLQFLSSNLPPDEDPKLMACVAAFDLQGKLVHHIEGVWGLSAGRLWRRTKSVGGSYILLDPETLKTTEIPVPEGWTGFLRGIVSDRNIIWWYAWRLDNPKVDALLAFGKQGIVAILPRPHTKNFLGAAQKIVSAEPVIGTDGRVYVAQCGEKAFYILEVDTTFLKR